MFDLYFSVYMYICVIYNIKDVRNLTTCVQNHSEAIVDLNLNLSFRNEPDGLCFVQRVTIARCSQRRRQETSWQLKSAMKFNELMSPQITNRSPTVRQTGESAVIVII